MPELPEVENFRRSIEAEFARLGVEIMKIDRLRADSPVVRFLPDSVRKRELLFGEGQTPAVTSVRRRGKILLFDLESRYHGSKLCLGFQLGMSGSFSINEYAWSAAELGKHDHLSFSLIGVSPRVAESILTCTKPCGEIPLPQQVGVLTFSDPRRFGKVFVYDPTTGEHPWIRSLGPDPILDSGELTVPYLMQKALRQKDWVTVKDFLLDQSIIAGIGNIYANEILWATRIHPGTKANKIIPAAAHSIIEETLRILGEAIELGGSSVSSYRKMDGEKGQAQSSHKVYGRRGRSCPRSSCNETLIQRIYISDRSTFFCPNCQVLHECIASPSASR